MLLVKTKVRTTLISHFYNESYLLPHWVKHHLLFFDDAILIDYASTDDSVAIIKDLAPRWTVVPSRNKDFDHLLLDEEVMDYETQVSGWKCCLNTTEFILAKDFRQQLRDLTERGEKAATFRGYKLSDFSLKRQPIQPDVPLVLQRHYGCLPQYSTDGTIHSRNRLIHRHSHGNYWPGRHGSKQPSVPLQYGVLFWYCYSPMPECIERKLQIYPRVSVRDREVGAGYYHFNLNRNVIIKRWAHESQSHHCYNLLRDKTVRICYDAVKELHRCDYSPKTYYLHL